ncbi:MAG TPA: hypothetical protein VGY54_11310 [Polyangiaceae bacterium]|jgi:hypothetical protein|nr:hypothetical protein [Polyangiaceae bacterium]
MAIQGMRFASRAPVARGPTWYYLGNVVSVRQANENEVRFVLEVRVVEGGGETRHEVVLAKKDHARLARPGETAEAFVERCFAFLLAREPKESILPRFDVAVIARYFPDFETAIR